VLGLFAAGAHAQQPNARAAFDAGLQAYAASNYPAASNAFLAAAAAAPAEKLDPAAAFYNAGLAAYAGGDLKAAADSFARAASGSDLALQSKAYYNRGNALFQQAGAPAAKMQAAPMPMPTMSSQELASAEASVGEAIQMFENAIALDPKDVDAKANYELAVLKQQQLQQQKQQQQDQQQQDQQKQDQQNQNQQQQDQQQEEQKDQRQKQQEPQAEQKPQPQKSEEQHKQEEQIQADKPSEEMTPEEAAMMLDAMKAQEQSQRDQLHPFFGRPVPVEKDW
jgi:Ca-activated chloride channel family protein